MKYIDGIEQEIYVTIIEPAKNLSITQDGPVVKDLAHTLKKIGK